MRSMTRARTIYRLVRGKARLPMQDAAAQPGLYPLDDEDEQGILTESPDPKLDYITRLAVQATGADIGGISLMFKSRIWLPSHIGIQDSFFPREG